AGEPVPRSKPADLTYDPASPLPPMDGVVKRPAFFYCFYLGHEQGFLGLFGDGRIQLLRNDIDEHTLRGFITRNDGEKGERHLPR
ncbi:MAG TPA: hypothetical protein VH682_13545, partial [Gemmataceae bacterium]